jgi:Domain of unknown function (DUF6531)
MWSIGSPIEAKADVCASARRWEAITWRLLRRSTPAVSMTSLRTFHSRAPRRGLRSTGQVLWRILLLILVGSTTANATSPCWEWQAIEAAFGPMGSPAGDPVTALNNAVAVCNANNFCFENNGTAICGDGFSCSNYAIVGTVAFTSFPSVNAVGISYRSTNLQTGVTTTGNLGGGPGAQVVNASPIANPNGCQVYVSTTPPPRAQCGPTCNGVGDPINPASGGLFIAETDVESPAGRLAFKRFYNSNSSNSGDLGSGWSHSFSRSISMRFAGAGYAGGYTAR